jgi:hypothetical protein
VRGEIERELAADELRRSLKQTEASVRDMARIELDPPRKAAGASAAAVPAATPAQAEAETPKTPEVEQTTASAELSPPADSSRS